MSTEAVCIHQNTAHLRKSFDSSLHPLLLQAHPLPQTFLLRAFSLGVQDHLQYEGLYISRDTHVSVLGQTFISIFHLEPLIRVHHFCVALSLIQRLSSHLPFSSSLTQKLLDCSQRQRALIPVTASLPRITPPSSSPSPQSSQSSPSPLHGSIQAAPSTPIATLNVTEQWALFPSFAAPPLVLNVAFCIRHSGMPAQAVHPVLSQNQEDQERCMSINSRDAGAVPACNTFSALMARSSSSSSKDPTMAQHAADEYRALLATSFINTVDLAENLGSTGRSSAWGQ